MNHPDDAFAFLVKELKNNRLSDDPMSKFDVVIDFAVSRYLAQYEPPFQRPVSGWGRHRDTVERIWPLLMESAYELCRRGILRPGPRGEPDGTALKGFVITTFGKKWLADADHEALAVTLPGRFEQLIGAFTKFGPGFMVRAREAAKAYHAGLYLACCTMCGAASESILLQLAIHEMGLDRALEIYDGHSGRNTLKTELLKSKTKRQRDGFERHFHILGYARDDAAHGKTSELTEHDAFLALLTLFRLAQFSNKEL